MKCMKCDVTGDIKKCQETGCNNYVCYIHEHYCNETGELLCLDHLNKKCSKCKRPICSNCYKVLKRTLRKYICSSCVLENYSKS